MCNKNTSKFKITTFLVTIIISLLIIYIHLSSHNKKQETYVNQTEKTIMDMKKSFLEDTVNNIFREIDKLRKTKLDSHYKNTEYRLSRIEEELGLADDEFVSFFTNKFEGDSDPDIWSALLWDDSIGEILYAS